MFKPLSLTGIYGDSSLRKISILLSTNIPFFFAKVFYKSALVLKKKKKDTQPFLDFIKD